MNYDPAEILAAQEHFGFARPAPIEKDWHILRAMGAIASIDAAPFKFVFAGGTSLARAHKIVRRMSEDVDFKIMELAGVARVPDPTLVRHIYNLHVTSAYYDATEVAQLAREIMPLDADEFANQFPAYRENPVEETRRALAALETEHHFAQRYTEFLQLMVYGVKPDFDEAMATIASLVGRL